MSYSGLPSLINSWHHHHFDCSRVTLRVFLSKTKQLRMHGTLASLKKKQSAFLSSSSFELHAVLTLWNMNFLVTCHCFASATKVLFVESSIYDFGSMLSSVWKDGHFLSSCEKNIERCLKDKWQMASTSLMTKIPQKAGKSHIPPYVGSNLPIQKCKQQWWLSRHHFHHLLFIVLHMSDSASRSNSR